MCKTWVGSLGREDSLEKEMATHSSTLAWKIPWTEEPGRLHSPCSCRVGHNWVTSLSLSLLFETPRKPFSEKWDCIFRNSMDPDTANMDLFMEVLHRTLTLKLLLRSVLWRNVIYSICIWFNLYSLATCDLRCTFPQMWCLYTSGVHRWSILYL